VLAAFFLRFAPDRFRLTIPTSLGNIECQRRCAPTPDRFPSGIVIGFPPESPIAFSGILSQREQTYVLLIQQRKRPATLIQQHRPVFA
jgi:hypothetical protein